MLMSFTNQTPMNKDVDNFQNHDTDNNEESKSCGDSNKGKKNIKLAQKWEITAPQPQLLNLGKMMHKVFLLLWLCYNIHVI